MATLWFLGALGGPFGGKPNEDRFGVILGPKRSKMVENGQISSFWVKMSEKKKFEFFFHFLTIFGTLLGCNWAEKGQPGPKIGQKWAKSGPSRLKKQYQWIKQAPKPGPPSLTSNSSRSQRYGHFTVFGASEGPLEGLPMGTMLGSFSVQKVPEWSKTGKFHHFEWKWVKKKIENFFVFRPFFACFWVETGPKRANWGPK